MITKVVRAILGFLHGGVEAWGPCYEMLIREGQFSSSLWELQQDHFAIPFQDLKIKRYIVEFEVLSYNIGSLYFLKIDLWLARENHLLQETVRGPWMTTSTSFEIVFTQ